MNARNQVTLIGHRGALGYMTGNTIVSFKAAAAMGAEWVELDVRQTSDHRIVVFHDDRIAKDGPRISELSLARIRDVMGQRGVNVPELDEVIESLDVSLGLNIEIKDRGMSIDLLLERIEKCDPSRLLISSFMHDYLYDLRCAAAHIPIGLLVSSRMVDPASLFAAFDAQVLVQYFAFIDRPYVDQIHSMGKKLWVWPLENSDDIRRMAELGVDGVICDYPDRAIDALGGHKRCPDADDN
jgi:glycerophosphoryl diester phosphodiesterase